LPSQCLPTAVSGCPGQLCVGRSLHVNEHCSIHFPRDAQRALPRHRASNRPSYRGLCRTHAGAVHPEGSTAATRAA